MLNNKFIKKPKITVIITYFNLGKYINDCVNSILEQTYQNFEIIIVNDASDKKNSQIVNSINNGKVRIINNKENSGQLLSFLEGLKYSNGEFVCIIDADDILLPNYLKTLLYAHLNYNYALISSGCGEINENNEITSFNYVKNPIQKNNNKIRYDEIEKCFNQKDFFEIKKINEPFGLWSWNPSTSVMFRRTSLNILKYFPDKSYWKTGADKVIFSLLHLVGGSANISSICYLYRHHSKNNSNTTLSTGDKKFLSEKYIETLINWNKKLRVDTLKMLLDNKKELIKEYNKLNYTKMLLKVIFCINIKVCAKIIKTFAHKLIQY